MYSGEDTTGQPTDFFKGKMSCYWCGSPGHNKFNCHKFKAGEARTAGYNGVGKWKGGKKVSGGDKAQKREKSTSLRYL